MAKIKSKKTNANHSAECFSRVMQTYCAKQIAEFNGKNVAWLNSNGCFRAIIYSTLMLLQSKPSRKTTSAFSLLHKW